MKLPDEGETSCISPPLFYFIYNFANTFLYLQIPHYFNEKKTINKCIKKLQYVRILY